MKDHAGFLQAAGLVARAHPKVPFVLAGRGVTPDEPILSRMIQEHHLQDRVFLLGERPKPWKSLSKACVREDYGPDKMKIRSIGLHLCEM